MSAFNVHELPLIGNRDLPLKARRHGFGRGLLHASAWARAMATAGDPWSVDMRDLLSDGAGRVRLD